MAPSKTLLAHCWKSRHINVIAFYHLCYIKITEGCYANLDFSGKVLQDANKEAHR
jgi:hypothetical protein